MEDFRFRSKVPIERNNSCNGSRKFDFVTECVPSISIWQCERCYRYPTLFSDGSKVYLECVNCNVKSRSVDLGRLDNLEELEKWWRAEVRFSSEKKLSPERIYDETDKF